MLVPQNVAVIDLILKSEGGNNQFRNLVRVIITRLFRTHY